MDGNSIMHTRYRVSPQTEAITNQFYAWDYRLRGYDLFPYPVHPEPVFIPFFDVRTPPAPIVDDARRHTLLSGLIATIKEGFSRSPKLPAPEPVEDDYEPDLYVPPGERVEFQISLPRDTEYQAPQVLSFLQSLRGLRHPITFELIGTTTHVLTQVSCVEADVPLFESQLSAFFPKAVVTKEQDYLLRSWVHAHGDQVCIVDFGLGDECGVPIETFDRQFSPDPFISLIAALEKVSAGACAVLQVMLAPVRHDWRKELLTAITDYDGTCIFADAPELMRATEEKVRAPLFAVVLRAGAVSHHVSDARSLVQRIGSALGHFDAPGGNRLIPLQNDSFPDAVHEDDLLMRITHRAGMLLSAPELIGLVHLPTMSVASQKLLRADTRTKECPRMVLGHRLVLGTNTHRGVERTVSLSEEQRMRHTYIVGASGTGKSTLLLNLISQDLANGEGLALLDPHGDLTESVLSRVPEHRKKDVILFDASDEDYPIGFNIFHAHSEAEKTLLASDLVTTFERLSTSWGDRMGAVLGNGILAMLEHPDGGTLLTLRRFLTDKAFRQHFLSKITEPEVRYYWEKEYPLHSGRPEASVLTRLDTFLRQKTIRNMVAQPKSSIDFGKVMDERKILLVKLSHGAIGEENAYLLGTLIVTAIHQAALRRQAVSAKNRTPFWLYIDEFQHFVTPSMEAILSGARKYNLGLILAHQERRQLLSKDREVASSVLSNPYTRICFRLGYEDAASLSKGLSFFDANDLQNLGIGQAIVRTEQAQYDFNLSVPWQRPASSPRDLIDQITEHSRKMYGRSREEIEAIVRGLYADVPAPKERPQKEEWATTPPPTPPEPEVVQRTERPQPPQPPPPTKVIPAPKSKQPGRGGSQHTYLQNLIKKYAEDLGYSATIEHEILGGKGFVDVSLTLGELRIACEISVSTAIEYEVQNVLKCLAAGYDHVVVICGHKSKLAKLQSTAGESLEEAWMEKVKFLEPDRFLVFLENILSGNKTSMKTVRGYQVSIKYASNASDEMLIRNQSVAKLLVSSMRKISSDK